MRRIRADKVESSVSIAGALALLASLKTGRGGWRRTREKRASEATRQHDASERTSSIDDVQTARRRRHWLWLDNAITGLWVALLLSIVAYAMAEGEAVMAQLDGLDLVAAHSLSP